MLSPVEEKSLRHLEGYDGEIRILSNRRRGIWCYSSQLRFGPLTRIAGRASVSATTHSLLVIALQAALKSIGKNTAGKLAGQRKPKIRVLVSDAAFVDALKAKIAGRQELISSKPLRSGRNFLHQLAKQIARFDLEFVTDLDDEQHRFQALNHWSKLHVLSPGEQELLPSYLLPVAVAQS
jgi:hypothetical protein